MDNIDYYIIGIKLLGLYFIVHGMAVSLSQLIF